MLSKQKWAAHWGSSQPNLSQIIWLYPPSMTLQLRNTTNHFAGPTVADDQHCQQARVHILIMDSTGKVTVKQVSRTVLLNVHLNHWLFIFEQLPLYESCCGGKNCKAKTPAPSILEPYVREAREECESFINPIVGDYPQKIRDQFLHSVKLAKGKSFL